MARNENKASLENPQLVSLVRLARRWDCSRQTCRRVLRAHDVCPFYLGGEARNATLRFDLQDILKVEAEAQGKGCSLKGPSGSRARRERRSGSDDPNSASTISGEDRAGRRR